VGEAEKNSWAALANRDRARDIASPAPEKLLGPPGLRDRHPAEVLYGTSTSR